MRGGVEIFSRFAFSNSLSVLLSFIWLGVYPESVIVDLSLSSLGILCFLVLFGLVCLFVCLGLHFAALYLWSQTTTTTPQHSSSLLSLFVGLFSFSYLDGISWFHNNNNNTCYSCCLLHWTRRSAMSLFGKEERAWWKWNIYR